MLKNICPEAVGDYVKMLFLDTICANPDRHTFNFGVLRDADNGEILGLAPNFDNNMALISRGYPKNITRKNDLLIKLFNELLEHDEKLKKYINFLQQNGYLSVVPSKHTPGGKCYTLPGRLDKIRHNRKNRSS